MWITPSAMFKGNLDPEIMVKVGMDGKKIGKAGSPSSESMDPVADPSQVEVGCAFLSTPPTVKHPNMSVPQRFDANTYSKPSDPYQ